MEVKNGYLLISDISGYTEFLVKSELLHAKEILDTLLKTGIESIRPPIRVLNTRGDAVLSFVAADDFLQPQSLIEAIEAIYIDFRRPLERVILNTTCMCKVCANMAGLDLKLFRHLVEVATRIWDLNGVWDHRQEKRRAAISYEKAWVAESIESWAPPLMAWDYATDAEQKRDYYDMISVVRTDKTPGRVGVGLQYHCRHNLGEVTFVITDWNPPSHFVNDEIAFGIPVQFTMLIVPAGDGSLIRIMYEEPREGDPNELESLFGGRPRLRWAGWQRFWKRPGRPSRSGRVGVFY